MAIQVAVDAMGGDEAPQVVVEGAVRAVKEADGAFDVLLVGRSEAIERVIEELDVEIDGLPIRIADAPEIIGMGEAPAQAVKSKKRSSIHLGLGAHARGEVDAFVSAGNTGAVMAASLFILGRLDGVSRPSVASPFPTVRGHALVLDMGTNVDCKPEHILQFARMGSVYASAILERERPSIGLLNIGEEPGKGDELTREAYELLEQDSGLHFVGNVEGRDLMRHAADVVVCDGFVGNVVLKLGESVATVLGELVKKEMQSQKLSAEQQQMVAGVLRGVLKSFDYQEYGGAPLLGVNGNVIIGHGSSSVRAIARMIEVGAEMARQDVANSIAHVFES